MPLNIIETTTLTDGQQQEILDLQAICNSYENLHCETLLANTFNLDRQMPCFFLGYMDDEESSSSDGQSLVAFLSLFCPEPTEIEVMACTAPKARRKGWFTSLYQAALPHMTASSAYRVLFQIEPCSASALTTLHTVFPQATLSHSEYQLSCYKLPDADIQSLILKKVTQQNKDIAIHLAIETFQSVEIAERSHIETVMNETGQDAFIAYDEDTAVGICNRRLREDSAELFGLGVRPSLQHTGYGKRLLASMLRMTLAERPKTTLEVDSNNPPALNLYLHNGFSSDFQIDYYAVPLPR